MITVAEFAVECGQTHVITRALQFCPQIAPRLWSIRVEWSTNMTRAAGYFYTSHMTIRLHPDLKAQGHCAVADTFLHELAHAMQWLRHHKADHGNTWHESMYQLGQQPVRCHSFRLAAASLAARVNPEDMDL